MKLRLSQFRFGLFFAPSFRVKPLIDTEDGGVWFNWLGLMGWIAKGEFNAHT